MERRYTKMAGTVHADAAEILAQMENMMVRNCWSSIFNPSCFLLTGG